MIARASQAILILAVLGAAGWLLWPEQKPMPAVNFTLTDGRTLSADDLRGKALVINFWSVSCEICLRDMPRLSEIHSSLAERDVSVIGVAMPYDPPPAVIAVVEQKQPAYPIALDVHGELAEAFGDVRVTPTTILVDRAGNIRMTARGPLDETRVRATLSTF